MWQIFDFFYFYSPMPAQIYMFVFVLAFSVKLTIFLFALFCKLSYLYLYLYWEISICIYSLKFVFSNLSLSKEKVYHAPFFHHKMSAGPFSHQTEVHTYFTQICDLLDLWLKYPWFFYPITYKFHLWNTSIILDEEGVC